MKIISLRNLLLNKREEAERDICGIEEEKKKKFETVSEGQIITCVILKCVSIHLSICPPLSRQLVSCFHFLLNLIKYFISE